MHWVREWQRPISAADVCFVQGWLEEPHRQVKQRLEDASIADVHKEKNHVMFEGKHIHFSEVDNKPLCSYSPKLCKQRRLNGYAFCIRHVLEDKTAPFKQCEFVAKYNSQRCTNPIPQSEDRRYCNSHLQVLGLVPKKERKKKNEQLDEVRHRPHLDAAMAVSLAVPSLALKTANGLDVPTLSPQRPRLPLQYLEQELDDPFAFPDDDECALKKGTVKRKLQTKLAQNRQQRLREPEIFKLRPEHFNPHPVAPQLVYSRTPPLSSPPKPTGLPQGLLCKASQPPTPSQSQGTAHCTIPTAPAVHSPNRKPHQSTSPPHLPPPAPPPAPAPPAAASTSPRADVVILKASNSTPVCRPHVACVSRLQRLAKLCAEKQLLHRDLFPHLGLDWSEDSEEEEEEDDERVPSCQDSCTLGDKWTLCSPDPEDEATSTRSLRMTRLCTYLQHRYMQLCRVERAAVRKQRCRHAFRMALLQAANKEPDYTGQLLRELRTGSPTQTSTKQTDLSVVDPALCTGIIKGQHCTNMALPYTRHCFQHILLSRSQQLFSSCTAKFADGQQCSIPVFDITHQTPLCEEHAKKMDNFLRGDSNRKVQQQRKPRKKTKPPALTKKHKKKRRRGPRRPQKPIPPAVPQGNLSMPGTLGVSVLASHVRNSSTPELSADEITDDITNEITDMPNDLELNQEELAEVLQRLPDDLQDFDLFEGKNGELLPTTEEAEELERALEAVTSYAASLERLSSIGDLSHTEGEAGSELTGRGMGVFAAAAAAAGMPALSRAVNNQLGDLLNGRMAPENFTNLELDENLLHPAALSNPESSVANHVQYPAPSSVGLASSALSGHSALGDRTYSSHFQSNHASPRAQGNPMLGKSEDLMPPQQYSSDHSHSSPHSSHYSSEHVPSPYSDHITSPLPHTTPYSGDSLTTTFPTAEVTLLTPHILPAQLEVSLGGAVNPRPQWSTINLSDPATFSNLISVGAEGHLLSTSLSTPLSTPHSASIQTAFSTATPSSTVLFPGLTQAGFSNVTTVGPSSPPDLLISNPSKQQLPQFSAAFGPQLASSHSGIPKDVQPTHSSIAPPTGFAVTAPAAATSTNNVAVPFSTQK
uniref:INO80 complex subunit Da n=1 Tax=Callorhinchus milii TaxID=7868 RepID=A0A4W3II62_CALMI|eukprot:gi/632964108/ref/XP_007898239.1/ PREDICTED: INO80 complex subunit D [Callorhinchus milii]